MHSLQGCSLVYTIMLTGNQKKKKKKTASERKRLETAGQYLHESTPTKNDQMANRCKCIDEHRRIECDKLTERDQ